MWEKWSKWCNPRLKFGRVWKSGNADRPLARAVLQAEGCPAASAPFASLFSDTRRRKPGSGVRKLARFKRALGGLCQTPRGLPKALYQPKMWYIRCSYLLGSTLWLPWDPISCGFFNYFKLHPVVKICQQWQQMLIILSSRFYLSLYVLTLLVS